MPEFQATVHLMRKRDCLKPEEPVVLAALHQQGFSAVTGIRIGACHVITITANNEDCAREITDEACREILTNLVTDTYEIVSIKAK